MTINKPFGMMTKGTTPKMTYLDFHVLLKAAINTSLLTQKNLLDTLYVENLFESIPVNLGQGT